mmetsp:Transcript_2751/g.3790  ORF Transcript_2751/g.3790 Transcript_2751/m.3790 type:complete len:93 (+) Transcript_2751:56-334(+)
MFDPSAGKTQMKCKVISFVACAYFLFRHNICEMICPKYGTHKNVAVVIQVHLLLPEDSLASQHVQLCRCRMKISPPDDTAAYRYHHDEEAYD